MEKKNILVGFLGNVGRKNDKGERKYKCVDYTFEDGRVVNNELFSFALIEYLNVYQKQAVDKLVLLGTTGSMWDNLFDQPQTKEILPPELKLFLNHALDPNTTESVTQNLLNELSRYLSAALNITCYLELIPEGNNQAEQIQTLGAIINHFNADQRDNAILDVTHGFRHLPMLTILGALLLKNVYEINIHGLYYGKLITDSKAEAIKLDGLLEISDWLQAFSRFGTNANYGVFGPLLSQHLGPEAAATLNDKLEQAAFYDATGQLAQSKNILKALKKMLLQGQDQGLSSLFKPIIIDRIRELNDGVFHVRQFKRAKIHLEHKNYLEAACFGYESMLSKKIYDHNQSLPKDKQLNPENYQHRHMIEKDLKFDNDYLTIKLLRNALVHGTESNAKIEEILANPQRLHRKLSQIFENFEKNL